MLKIIIDKEDSSLYIYQQIYEGIKQMILDRQFIAYEKLPSKRTLAKQLNVSINSITTAYEQLLAEGYIFTIERSGYFVEDIKVWLSAKKTELELPKELREIKRSYKGWLSLSHISVDANSFPYKQWLTCEQKALKVYREELGYLSHFQGPLEVRRSIAHLIEQTRGVNCRPEQIVIGASTQNLMERLISIFPTAVNFALENPGYHRFYQLLESLGYSPKPIPLDDKGIDVKKLAASKAEIVVVTPSHQFPTGKIMPISRRMELLNWVGQNKNYYIIEDDYDSEYKYKTIHIPSLQSLDQNQQIIYVGTFSKTLLPSLRVSYMVLPFNLLKKYREKYSSWIQEVNTLNLYTLHNFIEEGFYQKHVRNMTIHYGRKRAKLIKLLQRRLKDKIIINDIPAGLHFLAFVKTNKTYVEIKNKAKKLKLQLYFLDRFTIGSQLIKDSKVGIIIGFANIKTEEIKEAVERLVQAIE